MKDVVFLMMNHVVVQMRRVRV